MVKRKFLFSVMVWSLLFSLSCPWTCSGAFDYWDVAARPAAMALCYSSCGNDAAALFFSPAGLGFSRNAEVSLSGGQFYPAAAEDDSVMSGAIAASFPLAGPRGTTGPAAVAGFGFHYFGFNIYKEKMSVLAFALPFFGKLSVGLSAKAHELFIQGCGSLNALSFDMGLQSKISSQLVMSAFFRNLTGASLTSFSEDLSRGGEVSSAYKPLEGSLFVFGVDKFANNPVSFAFALEQKIISFCTLRAGFRTGSPRFSAGVGLTWKEIILDQTFVYQEMLGPQYLASIRFLFLPAKVAEEMRILKQGSYTGEKLDINYASEKDFQLLPKIGPSTAKNIINYRIEHGPFSTVSDIMKVKRIGPKTYEKIKDYITVESGGKKKVERKPLFSATEHDLILVGIPPMTAIRIVEFCQSHPQVSSWDDFSDVDGIVKEDFLVLEEFFSLEKEGLRE